VQNYRGEVNIVILASFDLGNRSSQLPCTQRLSCAAMFLRR
jgi:hypothetical protein